MRNAAFILIVFTMCLTNDLKAQNVGIGTNAPSEKLHVVGGARITSLSGGTFRLVQADANGVLSNIIDGNSGQFLTTSGAGVLSWANGGYTDADNGLYYNSGVSRIRLGGPLVETTTITQGAFGMTFNLSGTGDFRIQDAGVTTFEVRDNGVSLFGDDVYWRDGSTGGTNLMVLTDDGNDGRLRIYENGLVSVDLDANSQFVFNQQGLARNFRIESLNNNNIFNINGATDQIGFFVPNSPFGIIRMEASFSDPVFPWIRFINTDIGNGSAFIAVAQNAASGGSWTLGAGMSGTSDTGHGVSGFALTAAVAAYGGYFENDGAFANVGGWSAGPWTIRKIVGNGNLNTIVDDLDGKKVLMTAPEAPDVLFQDYGVGKLVNGNVHIDIDPIMTNNIHVDDSHPIKIFIQLEGECNGVYVTNKSAAGFDVVELEGGNSNVNFSWSVVANRANVLVKYSDGNTRLSENVNARFGDAPEYQKPQTMKKGERYMLDYNPVPVND